MSSNTDDLIWTDDRLKKITSEDGTEVNFWNGLGSDDRQKLKDHHVMDVLTNHVNADLVEIIGLSQCGGITNDTLIQISNMCPQLEELYVRNCKKITDDGITAIAKKCGQQLKRLHYSLCKKCTDSALESVVNNCNQLEQLWAANCGISTIPEKIGYDLPNLKTLNLSNNKITKIPLSLTLLKDTLEDNSFDISGNPLQVPPL